MTVFELTGDQIVDRNFEMVWKMLSTLAQIPFYVGTGSPETVVTASPPAIYFNRSGGASTTVYLKESGVNTNTGWVAK